MKSQRQHLLVCGGTGCHSQDSHKLIEALRLLIKKNGYENEVSVIQTGCFGFCEKGPIIKVLPDNIFYVEVKPRYAKKNI